MLKDIIEKEYGSINKCYDHLFLKANGEMPISRNHFYKLVMHQTINPGVATLKSLSEMLNVPFEAVLQEYLGE